MISMIKTVNGFCPVHQEYMDIDIYYAQVPVLNSFEKQHKAIRYYCEMASDDCPECPIFQETLMQAP